MKFFWYNFISVKAEEQIIQEITELVKETRQYDRAEDMMVFCLVPSTCLKGVLSAVDRHYVKIGAQNMSPARYGQVNGELSLPMLKALGTDMVLVGSADRRVLFSESDKLAGEKLREVLAGGFKSLLGVGELEEHVPNVDEVLKRQIKAGFTGIPRDSYYRTGALYQPYHSLGEEGTADGRKEAAARAAVIRKALHEAVPQAEEPLPVFYGGKMTMDEAVSYLEDNVFDGIFADDRQWTHRQLIALIHKVMDK